jgi:ParB family transcriptional regulator, chromosome partitioning protein
VDGVRPDRPANRPAHRAAGGDPCRGGFNPRDRFERKQLDELARSIAIHGLLQPLVVAENGDGYRLIAGERRYRAAQLAGLEQVPVVVREPDEGSSGFELAIVENVERVDLDPVEEAKAYQHLMDEHGLTRKGVAERLGVASAGSASDCRSLTCPKRCIRSWRPARSRRAR